MDVNLLISEFKSKWLDKAKDYAQNPMRIQQLIPEIKNYVTKAGLKSVKDDILLSIDYLKDIISGEYKDYNPKSLMFLVAAMIYLITPLDFVPDLVPMLGLTDDVSVILFVFSEFKIELDLYKNWRSRNLRFNHQLKG